MAEYAETNPDHQVVIQPKVDPVRQRCKPELYDPINVTWPQIRGDILRIEQQQFGKKAFDEELFIKDFSNPQNTVILLRDTEIGKIVGFTYAEPIGNINSEREAESHETAYISDTVLDTNYQGHHLVEVMMHELERQLVNRGYKYMERHTAVAHNYAANVAKTYHDHIVAQGEPQQSKYGPQVFFRIKLTDTR